MALSPPNVTFDVYTGFNPANPYAPPTMPARRCDQQGFLRQHVRNGRFGFVGYGQPLHWTTLLLLPLGSDVRDGWDGNANVYREANGDTILMHDYPVPGTCSAFVVAFVQNRGGALRCYLDRAQPSYGVPCPPCPGSGSGGGGGSVIQDGCCNTLPAVVYLTVSDVTDQRNGNNVCWPASVTVALAWNALVGTWSGSLAPCDAPGTTMQFLLRCQDVNPLTYTMISAQGGGGFIPYASLSVRCSDPLEIDFAVNGQTSQGYEFFVSPNYAAANARVTA
jgi:hypothetical protein